MRIRKLTLLLLVAFLCVCSISGHTQQPEVRTIYVSDVTVPPSLTDEERKIGETAVSVIELRLNSMRELQVRRKPAPCTLPGTAQRDPAVPLTEQTGVPHTNASPVIYEVKTSIKMLSPTNSASELMLEYDLLKYVQCQPVTIVHRQDPISLKTAFQGLLQMGDVLEVTLKDDLAVLKTAVDLEDISSGSESQQVIKDYLANNLLNKLAMEPDFKVRDLRGIKPPDSPPDYIITGKLLNKDRRKGVEFAVRDVKVKKLLEPFFIPGPVGQKNPEEKALAEFYEKASQRVINSIRAQRDSVGPLSDAEVPLILKRASELLCKNQPSDTPCDLQPESAIPILARLRDYDKATSKVLELLGDAYAEAEEHQKAADSYDQALAKLPTGSTESEVLLWLKKAADELYKAQNYANAAERYERAIDISVKAQLPVLADLYLLSSRSYRIAGNRIQALQIALRGLNAFSASPELDEEVDNILKSMAGEELASAYQVLSSNQSIGKIAQKLPDVRTRFADYLIGLVVEHLDTRKFDEVDKHLKTIEALPLSAIPDEQQKRYRIARAIWAMEAKNDFDAVIATFTPLIEDAAVGDEVKLRLALASYARARTNSDSPDKTDYARASELLTKMTEKKPDSGVYNLLLATNHQLGKDQDSRVLVEEKLKANKDDSEALRALASLCIDYLGDLDCGETVIKQLEEHAMSNSNVRMSNVRLKVLRGNYAEAEKLIDHPVRSSEDPEVIQASFYGVWTSLALAKETEAAMAFGEWLTVMEKFRGTGQRNYGAFDSASRGVEADQVVPANKKDLLRRMIAAMLTASEPLPKAADFFPASKTR